MNSSPTSTFQLTLEAVQKLAQGSKREYNQKEMFEAVSEILTARGHAFNAGTLKRCLVSMTPGSYKNVDYHAQLQGLMLPAPTGTKRWVLSLRAINKLIDDRAAGRRYVPGVKKAPKPKLVLAGTPAQKIIQVLYDQVFKDMGVRADYLDTWTNLTYTRLSQKIDTISRQDIGELLKQATVEKSESPVAGLLRARDDNRWELNLKKAEALLA